MTFCYILLHLIKLIKIINKKYLISKYSTLFSAFLSKISSTVFSLNKHWTCIKNNILQKFKANLARSNEIRINHVIIKSFKRKIKRNVAWCLFFVCFINSHKKADFIYTVICWFHHIFLRPVHNLYCQKKLNTHLFHYYLKIH